MTFASSLLNFTFETTQQAKVVGGVTMTRGETQWLSNSNQANASSSSRAVRS
jgi:hypothetical protein